MNQKELFFYCKHVRDMIELCQKETSFFKQFPSGYCSVASIWLYDYLTSKNCTNIEFRMNDPFLPDHHIGNHVWLHWNTFDIDITCDQFNPFGYNFPPVYLSNERKFPYQIIGSFSSRKDRIALEYNPFRIIHAYHNGKKERDIIYKCLEINFKY